MSGILLKKGKSNGLLNIYIAIMVGDTQVSSARVIFVPVPPDSTFKKEVAKLAD